MNVFQIRISWAAAQHQDMYYTGKLAIVLPEYAMNTAVFNQLSMQLLFWKPFTRLAVNVSA